MKNEKLRMMNKKLKILAHLAVIFTFVYQNPKGILPISLPSIFLK